MRKIIALTIIAVFVFSLIPLAIADLAVNANADTSISSETSAGPSSSDDVGVSLNSSVQTNAQVNDKNNLRENAENRLEKARESNLQRLEKLAELNKKQIEKLSKLSDEKLERISELEQQKIEKISDLNQSDMQKFLALGIARLKELAKLDIQTLKMELKTVKILKVRNAKDLDARNLTQAEISKARDNFEAAKDKFQKSKNALEDSRQKLKEAQQRHDDNATIESARNYLMNTSDAIISQLEKIKSKVQENSNIEANVSAKIAAEIDAWISEINSIKAAAQVAATKQQIKEAAAKLRAEWNTLQNLIRLHSERVVSARVEGVVNQGLVLEKKLDKVIAEAKDKNISVNVSAEMDVFSQKIAASRDNYTQAQAKISEAISLRTNGEPADSAQIKSLMDDSEQLLKEARDSIKQAHDELKIIVKKIKDDYPDAKLSSDAEVEIEKN